MKYSIIYLGLFCLFITSCKQQQKEGLSEDEMQQLFEQETANAKRAKYGNSNTPIAVIEDQAQVTKLKEEILEKKARQKQEELDELSKTNNSLTQRYKKGDKTVVSQIIAPLKGNDASLRKSIYSGLTAEYGEKNTYKISEPELIQTIFHNLSIKEDEKDVVQLAGAMELPGYVPLFEQQLLSGKAQEPDRLIYWLGKDGSSLKTIQYLQKQLDAGKFDPNKTDLYGVNEFSKNGNEQVKKAVFDFTYTIYTRKLIADERFKEIQTAYASMNPAIAVLQILLHSNDKKVIPIALNCLDQKIFTELALTALIKLDSDKYKELPLTYLRDKQTFYDALAAATELYKHTKDEQVIKDVLVQFEKMDNRYEDRIVSTIMDMGAETIIAKLETLLTDKALIQSIREKYELTKGSIETIAKDLYSMGVVDQPVPDSTLEKARHPKEEDSESGYIYNFLNASGVFMFFDSETGYVPVPYDKLIEDFLHNTNGKVKDFTVGMDARENSEGKIAYKLTVVVNNRAYTVEPEEIDDWYDIPVVLNLVNKILADASIKERFNFLDSPDQMVTVIFGPEENVKTFAGKYKL